MELFRISQEEFADRLASSGSANRWNKKGQNVLYTSSTRSLSTLELIVHRSSVKPTVAYKVMFISIPDDDDLIRQVQIKDLPAAWRTLSGYPGCQKIGAEWCDNRETLILKVPSAVIIQEYNYVINGEHPAFNESVALVKTEDYFWDSRLW
jgi:RES domain-containing protein